jgi:hypothetical protein
MTGPTQAIAAGGTTLSRGAGLDLIAELTKIGGIEITLGKKDVSTLTSPDDFREFIGTLFEAGEVPIEGNFIAGDTDGQVALMADQIAKTVQEFVITFPTKITATWSFNALVTKFKVGDYSVANEISFSASLGISGKPILAVGASVGPTDITVTGVDSLGALTLTPTYGAADYEYIADGSADNSVTVTVTTDAADIIKVNGSAIIAPAGTSAAIALTEEEITTITVVVTDTGTVPKTYVIRISGALGS